MVRFSSAAVASLMIASSSAFMMPNNREGIIKSINKSSGRTQLVGKLVINSLCKLQAKPTDNEEYEKREKFVNDGLFAWMQPYLDLFGYVEGNTVVYGAGSALDKSNFPSAVEQELLRKEAKDNMMNIGTEERKRRREAGQLAYKLVIGYSIFSSIFLDDGTISGNLARFAIALVRCILYFDSYQIFNLLFEQ